MYNHNIQNENIGKKSVNSNKNDNLYENEMKDVEKNDLNNDKNGDMNRKTLSKRIGMTGLPLSTQIMIKMIEPGDTLQSIALKYSCTVSYLSL